MRIQTNVSKDDFEVLSEYCNYERISISSLLHTLVTDFLDCTDKERVNYIVTEARKIKVGRPRSFNGGE